MDFSSLEELLRTLNKKKTSCAADGAKANDTKPIQLVENKYCAGSFAYGKLDYFFHVEDLPVLVVFVAENLGEKTAAAGHGRCRAHQNTLKTHFEVCVVVVLWLVVLCCSAVTFKRTLS